VRKKSAFTKAAWIIIILHLFFLFPACGKKGDPLPPEKPKAATGTENPSGPGAPK
jgi:predicted small lipoprotein YifL